MKRATPRVILAVGWLVFLLYAYPGYMPTSSVDQLIDSRYGTFTDWHSPVMTQVWRLVGIAVSGPAGMLLLQSGLVLFGSYVLLKRAITERSAAFASAGLLVFPPVMSPLAVISPEAQLVGFLVAAAAAFTSTCRWVRLLGLVCALLACGMREGAFLGALPIVVFGFAWREGERRHVRYAIAAGAWVAIAFAAAGLGQLFADTRTERRAATLAIVDIVGVLAYEDIDDQTLRDHMPGAPLVADGNLKGRARRVHGRPSQFAAGPDRLFDPPAGIVHNEALVDGRDWIIRKHPGAYISSRWYQFARVIGLAKKPAKRVFASFTELKSQRGPALHASRHSLVQRGLVGFVRLFEHTPLFAPYLYLALALVALGFAIRRRLLGALGLLASGIVYELSLFVVTWDAEYRYSVWMIVATLLAIAMIVANIVQSRAGKTSSTAAAEGV